MENTVQGLMENEEQDYGKEYQTKLDVKVVKKDGTRESFNVQKVINAVGKALTAPLPNLRMKKREESAAMSLKRWMSWNAVRFPFL